MKLALFFILVFIANNTLSQQLDSVDLRWKIGKDEKLVYNTEMSLIDTTSFEFDFGLLSEIINDSTKEKTQESKELFNRLKKIVENIEFETILTKKENGIIDLVMSSIESDETPEIKSDTSSSKKEEVMKLMQSLTKGVFLRGSLYESGDIHSFWVKSQQKNIISIFFQLPSEPVKIGDKWELDVNLINNDHNFKCDSSYKINEVMLTDIKIIDSDTVAVLEYNIQEFVTGEFDMPSFFSKKNSSKETVMSLVHQGIAEFSITNGRWVSYTGIMSLNSKGFMNSNTKTKFSLIAK
ncbi:MAG: hypothetical protein ACE364_01115 [Chlorobiota bacterium]